MVNISNLKVFVISDLHLGGRPHDATRPMLGSQICHAYHELTRFIQWVAAQGTALHPVELVINGDIVDFLMEDDHRPENEAAPWLPDEALVLEKLKLIIARTGAGLACSPFEAMAQLLACGQQLTFILGNHDVELSLPAVRRYLEEQVLRVGAGGRFRFVFDGEAYVRGDLLIEHGNRYDPWNVIDHSALRQERSMLSRGQGRAMCARTSGHFMPPPGSLMVIKVINVLKRKYRFVDLLKPESHAAIPILLALHPKLEVVLNAILQAGHREVMTKAGPAQPWQDGQLSANGAERTLDLATAMRASGAGQWAGGVGGAGSPLGAGDVWGRIKKLSGNIGGWADDAGNIFNLGHGAATSNHAKLLAGLNAFRGAMQIRRDVDDSAYADAARVLAEAGGFACVVFGHTHLPKHIEIDIKVSDGLDISCGRPAHATYLNTGTWADIMRVPQTIFAPGDRGKAAFGLFLDDLKNNRVDAYLGRELTYAEIDLADGRVTSARLGEFCQIDQIDQLGRA